MEPMPDVPDESPKLEIARPRFSKWVAFVLDDLIRIPGTNRRVGLDPIIGLLPGAGDFFTSAAGLTLLAAGARRKVPVSVYLRMASNWVLNSLVGAIPFAGDAFSFWFKSNRRNYELLRAHLDEQAKPGARKAGWWPMVILLSAVTLVFVTLTFLALWTFRALFG